MCEVLSKSRDKNERITIKVKWINVDSLNTKHGVSGPGKKLLTASGLFGTNRFVRLILGQLYIHPGSEKWFVILLLCWCLSL